MINTNNNRLFNKDLRRRIAFFCALLMTMNLITNTAPPLVSVADTNSDSDYNVSEDFGESENEDNSENDDDRGASGEENSDNSDASGSDENNDDSGDEKSEDNEDNSGNGSESTDNADDANDYSEDASNKSDGELEAEENNSSTENESQDKTENTISEDGEVAPENEAAENENETVETEGSTGSSADNTEVSVQETEAITEKVEGTGNIVEDAAVNVDEPQKEPEPDSYAIEFTEESDNGMTVTVRLKEKEELTDDKEVVFDELVISDDDDDADDAISKIRYDILNKLFSKNLKTDKDKDTFETSFYRLKVVDEDGKELKNVNLKGVIEITSETGCEIAAAAASTAKNKKSDIKKTGEADGTYKFSLNTKGELIFGVAYCGKVLETWSRDGASIKLGVPVYDKENDNADKKLVKIADEEKDTDEAEVPWLIKEGTYRLTDAEEVATASELERTSESEASSDPEKFSESETSSEPEKFSESESTSESETSAEPETSSEADQPSDSDLYSESESASEAESSYEPNLSSESEYSSEPDLYSESDYSETESGPYSESPYEDETEGIMWFKVSDKLNKKYNVVINDEEVEFGDNDCLRIETNDSFDIVFDTGLRETECSNGIVDIKGLLPIGHYVDYMDETDSIDSSVFDMQEKTDDTNDGYIRQESLDISVLTAFTILDVEESESDSELDSDSESEFYAENDLESVLDTDPKLDSESGLGSSEDKDNNSFSIELSDEFTEGAVEIYRLEGESLEKIKIPEDDIVYADNLSIGTYVVTSKTKRVRYICSDDESYEITISYDESSGIPDDAVPSIRELKEKNPEYKEYIDKATEAFNSKKSIKNTARVYDIALVDPETNTEYETDSPVEIDIKLSGRRQGSSCTDLNVVYFTADEENEIVMPDMSSDTDSDSAGFMTESLPVHAVVRYTRNQILTATDGKSYEITVEYDSNTGIPEDAVLEVTELKENDPNFDGYVSQANEILGKDKRKLLFARPFDIKLVDPDNGEKYEPDENVKVSMKLLTEEVEKAEELSVVHFKDTRKERQSRAARKSQEKIENQETMSGEIVEAEVVDGSVEFETGSFSVFVFTGYTVDFHWGEYTYNLKGGSTIFLSELLETLINGASEGENKALEGEETADAAVEVDNSTGETENRSQANGSAGVYDTTTENARLAEIIADMSRVKSVTFSNPKLVKVEQKSSEQAENDWLLTSLAAFDTEEILTIRLADGSEIVVRVTDEQEGDLVPLTIEKKWDESIDWTSEPYASQKAANQTIEFLIYGKTNDSDPGTQITAYAESSGNTAVSSISESDHTDDISKWAKTVYVPKSVKVTENNEQAVKTFTSYTIEEVNLETAQGTRGSWDDPIVDYQEGKEEYKEYSTNVLPDGTRLYSAGDYPSETHLRLVAYGNWSISNITSVTIEYSVNNGKYNFSTKANFSSAKKLESNNNGHPEYIYRLKLLTAGDKDYKPIFKKLYINGVEEPVGSNQRITTAVIENGTLGGEYPWDLDVSSSGTTVNYSVMEMNRKLTVTNSFSLPVEEKVPVIVNKVWDDRITWTDSYFENWKDLNKEILLTVDGEAKTLKDSDSVATSELARNGQSSYKDATEHNAALQSFSKLFYVDNGFDATKLQEGTLQKPDDKYVWTNTIEETEWNKWVNLTDSGHTQKGYIHLHSNTSVKNSDTNEYQGVKKIIFQYTDGVNNDIIYQSTANVTNATLNEEGANYYIEVLLPSNVDMSSLTLANPQKYQYTPQGELRFAIQVCRTGEYYVNNLPKSVQGRARTAAEPETRYDNVSFCKSVPSGGKKIEATSNTLKAYFPTQYTITNSLSICKILDTDGVEHGFPTLNAAVTYSRNTATRDKAYAVDDGNGGKQCKIEMLVDYVIPSTDKVTLDSGTLSVNGTDVDYTDNIIITTADKIGNAGYKYTGKGDTATITRGFTLASAEDTDNNQLFTVTGDGAMLTFTNIIIDGDKTNHSGGKGSLVYVKGEKTNVPVLVIGTGATLQNAKSSGSTGGGAVYVTHGTVTVAAGGSIQNCVAENSDGGAIYAEKTGAVININGSLTGNSAEDGGAIKASGGVFINIYPGATLSGNTASKKGGAIYISGSVNMTGGSIDNNTAAQKGAGIYADSDGSISFSGSPVVYDNKVNDKQWNVEFSGNNNTSIKLSGELDDSAKIGVYAPGGHNKAGEPFGTAMSNTEANLEGFTNDRDETLFGVNAQDMGHTGSLIYWGRYICKIEDNNNVGKGTKQIGETNRYEHPFTTLNKALGYARNGFNNGSTMSGSNAASIQMLVDYVIPSTDIVTLNESTDNIIITTAATSGGIYNFTDTQEKKADEDKGTAILTRGFNGTDLFTVSNASAKLTTTDIIFDGDREGIVTGTARSGRAINASQANATVIIKDGSTFRNFYISGNSANGSVINTTGNLTLLNEEKEGTIRFDNNQTTGYGGSVYVSKVMTVSGGTDSKGEEIGNPGTVWFNNSKSGNDGGAVFCNGFRMNKNSGTLKFTDCATVGNGDYEGGAIQVQSNDFLIEKNTGLVHFENCYTDQTSGEGGAVSVFKSAKLTIECTENGNAKFINCAAAKTSGSAGGGALFTYDNGLNIITVTAENGSVLFENCSAKGAGGAIYQEKGLSIEFKNVKFINCTSGSNGGAVYTPGAIGMIGASFENCQAINGGGVYSKQDMSAAGEVSFSGCTASKAGGAIYDESFFLLNETVLIPQLSWGSNKSGSDKRSNIN